MNAKELLETIGEFGEVEFEINESNKKTIFPLFNELSSMGYSPQLNERNGQLFFQVSLKPMNRSNSKIIDITLNKKDQKRNNG